MEQNFEKYMVSATLTIFNAIIKKLITFVNSLPYN